MTSPHPILQEAFELITGTRDERYGDAWDDFGRQARLWSEVMHHPVTAQQVAMCMICTKLTREMHRPDYDNRLDLIGYAALLEYITKKGTSPLTSAEVIKQGEEADLKSVLRSIEEPFSHPDLEPRGLHPLPNPEPSHDCEICGQPVGVLTAYKLAPGDRTRYYCDAHVPKPDTRTSE